MQNSKPIRKINSEDSEEKELTWSEATSCDMGDLLYNPTSPDFHVCERDTSPSVCSSLEGSATVTCYPSFPRTIGIPEVQDD